MTLSSQEWTDHVVNGPNAKNNELGVYSIKVERLNIFRLLLQSLSRSPPSNGEQPGEIVHSYVPKEESTKGQRSKLL